VITVIKPMSHQSLALIHLIRPPLKKSASPPLLLMLHGVGSHERDLFDLAEYLDRRFFIVSARAPNVLGPDSYAWYPVEFTANDTIIDFEVAEDSRSILLRFIDELIEAYHIDPKRVYLMGFSQGAIMGLSIALTRPDKVAGIVVMSGRLLPEIRSMIADPTALTGFQIFMVHGRADPIVPIAQARATRDELAQLPVALTYREYAMGHQVTVESMKDVVAWLKARLDGK
jgi:phospholipase/carboxylesterase